MDWSENIICIKCNGDVNLLVCSDNDCPLAIHKECIGCPARYDDAGRFYCPYCWYKKAVAEWRHAMENALSKKRALMIFMDEVTTKRKNLEENKGAEKSRHIQLEDSDENANGMRSDYGESRQGCDALPKQFFHLHHKVNDEQETIQEEECEAQDPMCKLHVEGVILNGEHLEGSKTAEDNEHNQLKVRDDNVNITAGGDSKSTCSVVNILQQSIHHDGDREISGAEAETILDEESEASAGSNGQNPMHTMHEEKNISNIVEKIQEEDFEGFAGHKVRDPSPEVRYIEENLVQEQEHGTNSSRDQNPSLVVYEEENIQEKGLATLSASIGMKDSLQTVPLKDTTEDSQVVKLKIKDTKLSDKNEQNSPIVPSLRRLYATMKKVYVSSGKVDDSRSHS